MTLLSQKINAFDLNIVVDKLTTIVNFRFSYTLKNLKKYFDFIDWFRNYIAWYAQKFDVLQKRKILLLRNSSTNKKRQRKMYFAKIVLKKFIEVEYCHDINFDNTFYSTLDINVLTTTSSIINNTRNACNLMIHK